MKKTFIFAFAALLGLASCNNQPQQNDTKETKAPSKESSDVKIAYVEVDSIMSQYTYWKEVTKLMEQKEQNIQKTLASKQQSLQQAAAKFQQDIQANKYTQQQAQDAEGLQQRLGNEYQKLVADYNKALADSLHHFLESFNKDKKYTMILAKQGDNILYSDKSLDITDDVVKGLNKAYKGMKK